MRSPSVLIVPSVGLNICWDLIPRRLSLFTRKFFFRLISVEVGIRVASGALAMTDGRVSNGVRFAGTLREKWSVKFAVSRRWCRASILFVENGVLLRRTSFVGSFFALLFSAGEAVDTLCA